MVAFYLMLCEDFQVQANYPNHFQTMLLEEVYKKASPVVYRDITGDQPLENICDWAITHGQFVVNCASNTITELKHYNLPIGHINIQYFPNSITELTIERCGLKQQISTRTLPRCSIQVTFPDNKFFGSPDFTTLPGDLKVLYLHYNRLSGPIILCCLPKNLQIINLRNNQIKQNVLWYDLPKTIFGIYLKGNSIGELHAMPGSSAVENKKLFDKFKESNIH